MERTPSETTPPQQGVIATPPAATPFRGIPAPTGRRTTRREALAALGLLGLSLPFIACGGAQRPDLPSLTGHATGTQEGGPLPLFSFGVIADVQYADEPPAGTRFYRDSLGKLERCVADLNDRDLVFTIQLGDLIDKDFAGFDKLLPIYERLKTTRHHVLGNHDYAVGDTPKQAVPAKLGLKAAYYDFARKGWRFIVLDGGEVSTFADPPGSERHRRAQETLAGLKEKGASNAQDWNGTISPAQITWLKAKLDAAARKSENVLVFCHFPIYPQRAENLWDDKMLSELLESHPCVKAYLAGHNHAGEYAEHNGLHYLTFKGMVETEDTTAYAVLDVYPDRLKVTGFGRESSRDLLLRR